MVDGTMTVRDVMEMSKFSEFDTAKALYELLTRDLIEEVRGKRRRRSARAGDAARRDGRRRDAGAAAARGRAGAAGDRLAGHVVPESAELAEPARAGAAFVVRRRNAQGDLDRAHRARSAKRSRRTTSSTAIFPRACRSSTPVYISPSLLHDPWGHAYKYLPQPQRYLVIGFTPDEKPDTDLFLSHMIESGSPSAAASKPVTGGIQLLD